MVKVNGVNVTTWQNFLKKQGEFINQSGKKEYRKAFIGLRDAFDSSIEYHDQDLTDVYVPIIKYGNRKVVLIYHR
ncbi:hypothetical protein [Rickettsia rhipicephali]|uniref:hypothetical protein n=1 Tax=Rickettsia rhipicephali TaxID=33992 RepID=UPI0003117F86|nr:hypothetical protein [Rickettsia rhipicephali]